MEEHEITFLPKSLPKAALESPFKEIIDIYFPHNSNHPVLRIRKNGDKFEITKKQPIKKGDASHQLETTIDITKMEFDDLAQAPGKTIRKLRYSYTEKEVLYEIDLFQDNLKGLILVDVEFKTKRDKELFDLPGWYLKDVTQEEFIAGGVLAGKKYSDIQITLDKFGYQKIL